MAEHHQRHETEGLQNIHKAPDCSTLPAISPNTTAMDLYSCPPMADGASHLDDINDQYNIYTPGLDLHYEDCAQHEFSECTNSISGFIEPIYSTMNDVPLSNQGTDYIDQSLAPAVPNSVAANVQLSSLLPSQSALSCRGLSNPVNNLDNGSSIQYQPDTGYELFFDNAAVGYPWDPVFTDIDSLLQAHNMYWNESQPSADRVPRVASNSSRIGLQDQSFSISGPQDQLEQAIQPVWQTDAVSLGSLSHVPNVPYAYGPPSELSSNIAGTHVPTTFPSNTEDLSQPRVAPLEDFNSITYQADGYEEPWISQWQYHTSSADPANLIGDLSSFDIRGNSREGFMHEFPPTLQTEPSRGEQSRSRGQRALGRDPIKDGLLLQLKSQGLSYKEIKAVGGFHEAESTLRGRYRTLTKPKDQRLRKPEWTDHDIALLKHAVQPYLPITTVVHDDHHHGHRSSSEAHRHALNKVPWKQVADQLHNRGCYRYGNATVKKKYLEVMGLKRQSDHW